MVIDGVRFVFQYAPHSEAPAELTFYLPDEKAWCGAEIVSPHLHNLYTLRGAKVRDALAWSGYIDEAIAALRRRRGGVREPPLAGLRQRARASTYLKQAARHLPLPPRPDAAPREPGSRTARRSPRRSSCRRRCATSSPNRDYYGTVRHNAKAVYQFYFGWYDGNPANLDPLPPVETRRQRYVEAMGGASEVLRKGTRGRRDAASIAGPRRC